MAEKPHNKDIPKKSPNSTSSFRHLVRVADTDLDGNKSVHIALTRIKGVNQRLAFAVCAVSGISRGKKTGDLGDDEIKKLNDSLMTIEKKLPAWMLNRRKDPEDGIDKHVLTSKLQFAVQSDIRQQKKIKSYVGMRHAFGLPVRGQRTRSNFRKNKGKLQGGKKR